MKITVTIRLFICERFEPRSHFISRLSMIVRMSVVLSRSVVWQWLAIPQRTCTVVIFRVKLSCITSVDCIKLWLLTWLVNWVVTLWLLVVMILLPGYSSQRYGKRATKNVQLVLQHCCKNSWIAMLLVFHPHQTCLCNKSGCWQVWTWVVKRATSLFSSFYSNVAKQVSRFLLPVFPYLNLTYTCTKQQKQQAKRFLVYGSNCFEVIFKWMNEGVFWKNHTETAKKY